MAAPDPPAKFSLALGSKKAAPKQTTKKRPHSTLHDSDDEDAAAPPQQPQEVSHFDASAGGAIDASKPTADRGPLVIPKQGNRDWRAESQARKRQKSQLPSRAQQQQQTNGDAEHFEEEKPVFGLNVVKRAAAEESADGDADAETGAPAEPPPPPKTEDQLALEALLGEGKSSSLVVPIAENEEEAYQRDYERAPDVATLEEYEAVPVEEFGAAMLRGMGWKEGEAIGRRKGLKAVQPRVVERRPALLGIGAKPDAAIAEELGAWGKGGKASRGKPVQSYNPVVMRNTKTGEQLTEEELKQKVADQEAEALARERERTRKKDSPARDSERRSEKSSRRHKYDEGDYESDRRDRDRRKREKDSDRDFDSKNRSSRRDRSASDEDRNRRRKYDSKDYDRRDRDRERDRKHRDRSRDYSKSSSRREHRDRDRSRDRYRDSDRERRRRRDD